MKTANLKSPKQLLCAMEFAEVNGKLDADFRRVIRAEREALASALRSGDAKQIAAAKAEALQVAEMWGVNL